MATKVVLELDVRAEELEQFNRELQKTEQNFKDTQQAADKTSSSMKDVGENGGAIAILDELTGGLASRVRDAAEATKLFNFSLKGTRAALIGTGIGALVVGLGIIIDRWDDIKAAIFGATNELDEHIERVKVLQELNNEELALIQARLDLLKVSGKESVEVLNEEKKLLGERFAALVNERAEIKRKIFDQEGGKRLTAEETEEYNKQLILLETAIVRTRTLLAQNKQRLDGIRQINQEQEPEGTREIRPQVELVNGLTPMGAVMLMAEENLTQALVAEVKKREGLISDTEITAMQVRASIREQQLQIVADSFSAITNIAAVFGEENKALAIGSIIIDQVQAVSRIISNTGIANAAAVAASPLTAGQPWVGLNTASAAASIASSVTGAALAISQLKSNNTSLGSIGNIGSSSLGGGRAVSAPSFNVVGNTGINQIGQALNGQADTATKAYVVFGDIEKASQIENEAVQGATL